jgi:lambda repressor-like predicted transcriptional regulator
MVINDFNEDVKEILAKRGQSKADLARACGLSYNTMDTAIRSAGVTRGYVEICEYLDYDIKIRYVNGNGKLLNDFREDIKELAAGRYLSDIAYGMGMSRQLLDGRIKHTAVNKAFLSLCGKLGYDIELEYVKRN